jgi:hypothetical protein
MKNKFLFLFITQILLATSFSTMANAPESEEIEVIARIQTQGSGIKVTRSEGNDVIPSLLQNDQLKEMISALKPGDEAIIKGRITYQPSTVESQTSYRPIFIITSIRPISLKRLGFAEREKLNEDTQIYSKIDDYQHRYISFPISTEIASAVTLTSAALLMSSLSASTTQPGTVTQINSGLILFAGALATGVFIFEQITGKVSK